MGNLVKQIVVVGAAALVAGHLGSQIVDKINENEKSDRKVLINNVIYLVGCGVAGYLIGTILETEKKHIGLVNALVEGEIIEVL